MLIPQDRLVEWDECDEEACIEAARKNDAEYDAWVRTPPTRYDRPNDPPVQRGPVFRKLRGRMIALAYQPEVPAPIASSSMRSYAPVGTPVRPGFVALVIRESDGVFVELNPSALRHITSVPVTPKPAPTSIPGPGVPRG